MSGLAEAAAKIVAVGRRLGQQGLAPATAGNYSQRLPDGTIAVTVSGAHKARLAPDQVMRVDADGAPLDGKQPSAETLLHCLVYAIDPTARAVLHTHSVPGTVLSRATPSDAIVLAGYELLKIFPGLDTHEVSVLLPLVGNSQDMVALADELRPRLLGQSPLLPAFYIRGHGLYAWGPSLDAAEALVEACEFLFACAWEETKLGALR
jgi:methylthioribulose-1-phosphate dehydratase